MTLFDRERLYNRLTVEGQAAWADELRSKTQNAIGRDRHGNLGTWMTAWNQLPTAVDTRLMADRDAVTVEGQLSREDQDSLQQKLMQAQ